jgi:LysM repeat protein
MTETQTDIIKMGIGKKETGSTLKPARVTITGVKTLTEKADKTKLKTPLIKIIVKHPDREEPLEISDIKYVKNEKIVVATLWAYTTEEDGIVLLSKNSAVAELLRFFKANSLEELTGKEIEAVEKSLTDKYLCLKAY